MANSNEVFSAFAFIGFIMCAIPLPWHLESWNTGTCLFMIWTGLACLNQFINSVVWNGNAINWAPVWCDISTRFQIGSGVAIPAASLCINRRLYYIASVQSVTVTRSDRRRAVIVDLSIGIGLPVLEMCLQYIVQGHRFNIYEDVGCYFFTYNVWPAYLIQFAWPLAIGLVSAVYCVLSIRAFYRRQTQFKELLSLNNNLNAGRYIRLMCMAGADLLCTVPLSVYFIYVDLTSEPGLQPYLGWADTHADFYRVDQIPAILWRHNSHNARVLEVSRWIVVVCAFIFFMFFGFADEARKHYRTAYQTLVKTVGMSGSMTLGMTTSNAAKTNMRSFGNTSMPVFVRRQATSKRGDSIGSYNEKLSIADAGGALADYKPDPYTLTEFSGTTSTTGSTMPADDDDYSISMAEPPAIVRPEPTLDVSSIPRHPTDTPYSAHGSRHNSVDMV